MQILRDRARLIVGSVGMGLVLWGLVLFLEQMYHAIESGRLTSLPLRSLLTDRTLRAAVPVAVVAWLRRAASAEPLQGFIDWVLDDVPLPLFLAVVGGIAAWRALLRESPSSHRR